VNPDLLVAALTVAVPMWVEVVRGLPFEVRQERAQRCMAEVAEHGDHILLPVEEEGRVGKGVQRIGRGPGHPLAPARWRDGLRNALGDEGF
jgi:hypothetical protein